MDACGLWRAWGVTAGAVAFTFLVRLTALILPLLVPDLPVVLITGSISPDLERRAAELGARVMVKPLVEDDLLAFVGEAMR